MKWVRIRSWHATSFMDRGGTWHTYCGREVPGTVDTVDAMPDAKTCESCLRNLRRKGEQSS